MFRMRDYLTEAAKLHPDDDARQGGEEIARRCGVGAVVVDARDQVVGVLTLSDCLRALLTAEYYQTPTLLPVSAVMTRSPEVISTEDTISDVIARLLARSHSIFPVVDKRRRYVGVLCRGELFMAYLAALQEGRPAGVPRSLQRDSLSRLRASQLGPQALEAWRA
jgi:CBS domain-containing protein